MFTYGIVGTKFDDRGHLCEDHSIFFGYWTKYFEEHRNQYHGILYCMSAQIAVLLLAELRNLVASARA